MERISRNLVQGVLKVNETEEANEEDKSEEDNENSPSYERRVR